VHSIPWRGERNNGEDLDHNRDINVTRDLRHVSDVLEVLVVLGVY